MDIFAECAAQVLMMGLKMQDPQRIYACAQTADRLACSPASPVSPVNAGSCPS